MTNTSIEKIEETFKGRAKAFGLKKGTKAYDKERTAFFTGAMTAMHTILEEGEYANTTEMEESKVKGRTMNPEWVICIMTGQEMIFEKEKQFL